MPANTVKVDRTTVWGNPFVPQREDTIDQPAMTVRECLDAYRDYLKVATGVPNGGGRPLAIQATEVLRGKNLACWCKPGDPCHADVLLELANAKDPRP
jgi:hypothetical protein